MKIVVLDGYTANPGDLSWDELKMYGDVIIYDRTARHEVAERITDADIVLTNKVKLDRTILEGAVSLKYIGVIATGYNVVDIATARERGIVVTNVPAYGTNSVAQHTFALLLELTNHVAIHAQSVREGRWSSQPDFSYCLRPVVELSEKTMGIIGLGKIGSAVAHIALAMGMRVIASHKYPERDKIHGVTFVDERTCFKEADVVSLHCPQTSLNTHFVNKALLSTMKKTAFFINVSRGTLVNEEDLAWALNNEVIAGAGVDVLSSEPPDRTNPLLTAKNCIVTPHIAWASQASRKRLISKVAENIGAFLSGSAINVV